jgi:hypothetical protein
MTTVSVKVPLISIQYNTCFTNLLIEQAFPVEERGPKSTPIQIAFGIGKQETDGWPVTFSCIRGCGDLITVFSPGLQHDDNLFILSSACRHPRRELL